MYLKKYQNGHALRMETPENISRSWKSAVIATGYVAGVSEEMRISKLEYSNMLLQYFLMFGNLTLPPCFSTMERSFTVCAYSLLARAVVARNAQARPRPERFAFFGGVSCRHFAMVAWR